MTNRIDKNLLLVGSIPVDTVEQVFTTCSEYVGPYVPAIPDGEVGDRLMWVGYLNRRYYSTHPDIETSGVQETWSDKISRPLPAPPTAQPLTGQPPAGQIRHLQVKPGVRKIKFQELGYSQSAKESYSIFKRLRSQAVIPADVRFQVCVPLTNSAMGFVFNDRNDYAIVGAAIEETLKRELQEIFETIPAKDLMIQWDACWEVLDIENYFPYSVGGDKLAFNTEPVSRLGMNKIPDDVWMGYHLCYGTVGGWPMTKPKDLAVVVNLANALVSKTPRRVDYVHLPVARKAFADEYYAPLDQLKIGDT
jgi:hypothetical protein